MFHFPYCFVFYFRDIGGQWKPVQTAIISTTQSILDLQKLLIDTHGFSYVLTARFSQDSLGTKTVSVSYFNIVVCTMYSKNVYFFTREPFFGNSKEMV